MASKRTMALVAFAAWATIVLVGCAPTPPMPTPTTTKSATPTPTPTPVLKLDPTGTAEENFEYWEFVVKSMGSELGMADGAVFVQRLVDAGFNKADMELTPNETAIGEGADSVIFAVRFQGECLIGQVFRDWTSFVTRAPMLGTGTCLIGRTRPIDF